MAPLWKFGPGKYVESPSRRGGPTPKDIGPQAELETSTQTFRLPLT